MPRADQRAKSNSRRLKPILDAFDAEVAHHLIVLSIGYEDLRLELRGLDNSNQADRDRIGLGFDYFYYMHRAILSCREIANILISLESLSEFQILRDRFDPQELGLWDEAISFYDLHWRELKGLRDLSRSIMFSRR